MHNIILLLVFSRFETYIDVVPSSFVKSFERIHFSKEVCDAIY